jgi:acetolactate synthase regulatory subunit
MDQIQYIEMDVLNTPTILIRILMMIKQKRINIKCFVAEENLKNTDKAIVQIVIVGDIEKIRLLKSQFGKVVEVVAVY